MTWETPRKGMVGVRGLVLGALLGGLLAALAAGGAYADGATRIEFDDGWISGPNPCNGEAFLARGPVDIIYHAGGKHTLQLTFKGTANGSLGNTYTVSMIANEQFAAPSAVYGERLAFLVPFRAQFAASGSAPNFSVEGTVRVYVRDGRPVGAWIVGLTGLTCHG